MAFSWDNVEVRGADGLLQLGKVINCAEGGLIVDFECGALKKSQFVPFGQIYRSSRPIILDKEQISAYASPSAKKIVDALVREGPGEPWKWHQADLLIGGEGYEQSFGLVTVKLPNCSLKGIVSGYRIRIRVAEKQAQRLLVQQGFFTNESATISIPREHSAFGDVEDLHWNANAEAGQRLMRWFDQNSRRVTATSIIRTEHFGSSCGATFGILVCRTAKWTIPLTNLMKDTPNIRDISGSGGSGTTEQCCEIADHNKDDGKAPFLHKGILAEIFQSFSTVEQSKMRRVSAAWNTMLIQSEFSHVLRVSFGGECDDAANAACVYKNWKHHKIIIITGSCNVRTSKTQSSRMMSAFRLLHYMNKSAGPLQTLIVGNSCWKIEVLEWESKFQVIIDAFRKQLKFLSGLCQNLILRNVTITLTPYIDPYDSGDMYTEQPILYRDSDVIVHVLAGKLNANLMQTGDEKDQKDDEKDNEADYGHDGPADVGDMRIWWAKFDDGLLQLTPAEIQRLEAWIDDIVLWEYVDRRQWEIAFLLNMMQSGDPRDTVAYGGKRWYRDLRDQEEDDKMDGNRRARQRVTPMLSLDHVDVRTLTKLTQHSLLNRLDNQPYRLRVELNLMDLAPSGDPHGSAAYRSHGDQLKDDENQDHDEEELDEDDAMEAEHDDEEDEF